MRKAKWTKCSQWANMNSRKPAHLVFTCLFHQPLKNVCAILLYFCLSWVSTFTHTPPEEWLVSNGFGSHMDTPVQLAPSGRWALKCSDTYSDSKYLQSLIVTLWAAGILGHGPGWWLLGVQDFSSYLLKMLVLSDIFSLLWGQSSNVYWASWEKTKLGLH